MVKKKKRVIEIFKFKLKNNVKIEEFIKYSDKVQKFFEKEEGYEHRLMLKDKQFLIEQIQWRNEDYAKMARNLSKKSKEFEEYYNSIIPKSMKIFHPELVKMY